MSTNPIKETCSTPRTFKKGGYCKRFQSLVAAWSRLDFHSYPLPLETLLKSPELESAFRTIIPDLHRHRLGKFLSQCLGCISAGFQLQSKKTGSAARWFLASTAFPDTVQSPTSIQKRDEARDDLFRAWMQLPNVGSGVTIEDAYYLATRHPERFPYLYRIICSFRTRTHRRKRLRKLMERATGIALDGFRMECSERITRVVPRHKGNLGPKRRSSRRRGPDPSPDIRVIKFYAVIPF
jgi:hypothetical protein